MQLVAYGAQDIYLTGNPQITFFKVVYRRHTNFSMESIEQTLDGNNFDNEGRFSSTISRNGDLIHKCYFEIENSSAQIANPGAAWIKTATLEIGGQQIDKITGEWMEVWAELTEPNDRFDFYLVGTALPTKFQNMSSFGGVGQDPSSEVSSLDYNKKSFVPLPFWFCRNVGLSLPLIALQYHEVKLTVEHYSRNGKNVELYVDYIYLDTDERRRFAQVSHEYLIEQLQYQNMQELNQRLNFNHPVKEIIWSSLKVDSIGIESLDNASLSAANWSLKLNGHDRFKPRTGYYFTRQQVYDYHTGAGGVTANLDGGGPNDAIFVYSFALKPEEHQPSGTCNFSRIDSAILGVNGAGVDQGTLTPEAHSHVTIFAVNYNVLRIMSGMGGLAYSN